MRSTMLVAALCLSLSPVLAAAESSVPLEGRLKKISETKSIALAYRTDALPSSNENGRASVR